MDSIMETCPKCGGPLEFDEVDVGVGTLRGRPGCPDCYWTPDLDPREKGDDDGRDYADPRDHRQERL